MADNCVDMTLSIAAMALLMVMVRFLSHLTVPSMASLVSVFSNSSVSLRVVCLVAEMACSRKLTSSWTSACCDCCSSLAIIYHLLYLNLVHHLTWQGHPCCLKLLLKALPDHLSGPLWLAGRVVYCVFPLIF